MKTLKLKYTFIALMLTGAAIAQTGPVQPPSTAACLSGPVTKGSLTVSCSVIDNSASAVASDATTGIPSSMVLVNAASTDPDVIGVRITITCAWAADQAPGTTVRSGQISMPAPPPPGTGPAPSPFPLTYVFSNVTAGPSLTQSCASPIKITSVNVQELKASSSQSF